jgi:hypothetical protein
VCRVCAGTRFAYTDDDGTEIGFLAYAQKFPHKVAFLLALAVNRMERLEERVEIVEIALRMAHVHAEQCRGPEDVPAGYEGWLDRAELWAGSDRSCESCDELRCIRTPGSPPEYFCESDLEEFLYPSKGERGGCKFWSTKGCSFGQDARTGKAE